MKPVIVVSILFFLIALPAVGELTDADLNKIRLIVKEEVKTEITASETRTRAYIDVKIEAVEKSLGARIDATHTPIDGLDKRMNNMWRLMMGLFGLVAATIAVPQIIVAYRDRGRQEMQTQQQALQTQIDQLREKIEAMQQ